MTTKNNSIDFYFIFCVYCGADRSHVDRCRHTIPFFVVFTCHCVITIVMWRWRRRRRRCVVIAIVIDVILSIVLFSFSFWFFFYVVAVSLLVTAMMRLWWRNSMRYQGPRSTEAFGCVRMLEVAVDSESVSVRVYWLARPSLRTHLRHNWHAKRNENVETCVLLLLHCVCDTMTGRAIFAIFVFFAPSKNPR